MKAVYVQVLTWILSGLCLATAAPAQTCVPAPAGIVGWWPLDETSGTIARDIAGNHPAAFFGMPAFTAGEVAGALGFNGSADFLGAADSELWAFGRRSFTIELWVNFRAPVGGTLEHPGAIFIGNDEGPENRAKWFFALGGGYLNFHLNGPSLGPQFFPLASFAPQVGRWYHLAVTRNGDLYTIFVDGSAAGSATSSAVIPDPDAPLTIGQSESLGFVNGSVDEVTVYSRALTQDEIQAIVAAGPAGKCKDSVKGLVTVDPSAGGDTGTVSCHINGVALSAAAAIKLVRAGEPEIAGTPVRFEDDGGATTTFDLRGRARGSWDVVIADPGAASITLPGGFTVEEGRQAAVWADLVGRGAVRVGATDFVLLYGNLGNVDADGAAFYLSLPPGVTVEPEFPLTEVTSSSTARRLGAVRAGSVISTLESTILPFTRLLIRPGFVGGLRFRLTFPQLGNWKIVLLLASPTFLPLTVPSIPSVTPCVLWTDTYLKCLKSAVFVGLDLLTEEDLGATACFDAVIDKLCMALAGERYKLPEQLVDYTHNLWSSVTSCAQVIDPANLGLATFGRALGITGFQRDCAAAIAKAVRTLSVVTSYDPNDKVGAEGIGPRRHQRGTEPLRYGIFFENLASALAAARQVVVVDVLDPALFDLSTLSLGTIQFGDSGLSPPSGTQAYSAVVDLRPKSNLLVEVEASLDLRSGRLVWRFSSLDPQTGLPPDDPLAGFLPPDVDAPQGEGSVFFSVRPKALPTGTELTNQAAVTFDDNLPINTPQWLNTLDNTAPESHVASLAPLQPALDFEVDWSGTDSGSGVGDYTIFVSENGKPPATWLEETTATSAIFHGVSDRTYAFYSIARDLTGNVEDAALLPDATTRVAVLPPLIRSISPQSGSIDGGTPVTISGSGFAAGAAVTVGGIPVTDLQLTDASTLIAKTGPHPTGAVDVVLANPDGLGATLGKSFFYEPPSTGHNFFTLTPCRVVDTRKESGPLGGPSLAPMEQRIFKVVGNCGIPPSASAVALNVTVVSPGAAGFGSLFPGNAFFFGTSMINFSPGRTRASNGIVSLATDGTGSFGFINGSSGSVHLVIDVSGYFE